LVKKDQKRADQSILLSQVQIMNIVKRLYGDQSAVEPQG
jgi:hypothetical protein